jgi:hypothetical protein
MSRRAHASANVLLIQLHQDLAVVVRFQGLRVAYFCLDKDTTTDRVILNRIVSLKEDAGKAA